MVSTASYTGPCLLLVGVTGLEPATPCTPCRCATKLRHTPTYRQHSIGTDFSGITTVSVNLGIYGHLMPGWQKDAVEVLARVMQQGS